MSNDVPQIAFVLIELTPGKASVGLRFSNTPNRVDILTKYKDMEPKKAVEIIGKMVNKEISAQEIADEPYESHPFYAKNDTIFKAKN